MRTTFFTSNVPSAFLMAFFLWLSFAPPALAACTGQAPLLPCTGGGTAACINNQWRCPPVVAPAVSPIAQPVNPLGFDLAIIIGTVVKAIIGISGSVALLMFIYGGFLWLTAAGNTDRIDHGKDVFKWASLGLLVIFSSYIVLSQIFKLFS